LKNIENVDLILEEKGWSGVNQKLTNGFSDPENPYSDGFEK